MNANQRKKDRRQKKLVALGRDAESRIRQAEAQAAGAYKVLSDKERALADKDAAIQDLLAGASSLQEAIDIMRKHARRELSQEIDRHADAIAAQNARHEEDRAAWRKSLNDKDAQHQAALHAAVSQAALEVANLKDAVAKLKLETEEPRKLRQRLARKTQELQESWDDNTTLRARLGIPAMPALTDRHVTAHIDRRGNAMMQAARQHRNHEAVLIAKRREAQAVAAGPDDADDIRVAKRRVAEAQVAAAVDNIFDDDSPESLNDPKETR